MTPGDMRTVQITATIEGHWLVLFQDNGITKAYRQLVGQSGIPDWHEIKQWIASGIL